MVRAALADRFVGRDHIAQPGFLIDHIVPGQCRPRALFGKCIHQEVRNQPGCVAGHVAARVKAERSKLRHDARRHKERRRHNDALRPDRKASELGTRKVDAQRLDPRRAGRDRCGAAAFEPSFQPGALVEATGERAQPLRPGQHRAASGVLGEPGARAEIVQPGPGGDLGRASSIVVAAAVVEIPTQALGAKVVLVEPHVKRALIQCRPGRIARGHLDGHDKYAPPVRPALGRELVNQCEKPLALSQGVARKLRQRFIAVLPARSVEHALARRMQEVALIVVGALAIGIAQDDAQVEQEFPDMPRFHRGQRQVVRAGRVVQGLAGRAEGPGCGIAEELGARHHQYVLKAGLVQLPRRGQPCDARPEDQYLGVPAPGRRRQGLEIAQHVAELPAWIAHLGGHLLPLPESACRDAGRTQGAGAQKKRASVHQRIT